MSSFAHAPRFSQTKRERQSRNGGHNLSSSFSSSNARNTSRLASPSKTRNDQTGRLVMSTRSLDFDPRSSTRTDRPPVVTLRASSASNHLPASQTSRSSQPPQLRVSTSSLRRSHQEGISKGQLEGELIDNLNQQIRYLELENKFLREEVASSQTTLTHTQQQASEQKTLRRRVEEETADAQQTIMALKHRLEDTKNLMQDTQVADQREKQQLTDQVVEMTSQLEQQASVITARDSQLVRLRADYEKTQTTLLRVRGETAQLEHQIKEQEQLRRMVETEARDARKTNEDLRRRLKYTESRLRDAHQAGHQASARQESRLRRQIKELELTAKQERQARSQLADECAKLVQENAMLGANVTQLQRDVAERSHRVQQLELDLSSTRTDADGFHHDRNQLQIQLDSLRQQLDGERRKVATYEEQLSKAQTTETQLAEHLNSLKSSYQGDLTTSTAQTRESNAS
eukprot:m.212689 g.212689  ORF g.212689 m.212689 type:complete len:459 (+) comp26158_c0_seq3:28-1404(+)